MSHADTVPDSVDKYEPCVGDTPLFIAVASNKLDAYKLLMTMGAYDGPLPETTMMIAINRSAYDIVSYLISIGKSVNDNRTNISDACGLIDAIESRDLRMVAILVKAGADLKKTYEQTYFKHKRRCRCRFDGYQDVVHFRCIETRYITALEYAFILEYRDVAEVIMRCRMCVQPMSYIIPYDK